MKKINLFSLYVIFTTLLCNPSVFASLVIEDVRSTDGIAIAPEFVYHGSPTQAITVIEPRESTHGKALVYAGDSPVMAVIFTGDFIDDEIFVGEDKVNDRWIFTLIEKIEGAFDVYKNPCSIYQLSSVGFRQMQLADMLPEDIDAGRTVWEPEKVSTQPAPVIREFRISNAWEVLEDCARRGEINLVPFENAPGH